MVDYLTQQKDKKKSLNYLYISYNELTDRQKHEMALYDENARIYDCPKDFFADMNADLVDTENYIWFLIDID